MAIQTKITTVTVFKKTMSTIVTLNFFITCINLNDRSNKGILLVT